MQVLIKKKKKILKFGANVTPCYGTDSTYNMYIMEMSKNKIYVY